MHVNACAPRPFYYMTISGLKTRARGRRGRGAEGPRRRLWGARRRSTQRTAGMVLKSPKLFLLITKLPLSGSLTMRWCVGLPL